MSENNNASEDQGIHEDSEQFLKDLDSRMRRYSEIDHKDVRAILEIVEADYKRLAGDPYKERRFIEATRLAAVGEDDTTDPHILAYRRFLELYDKGEL